MSLQIRRRLEHNHWRLFNILVRLQYDESPPWAHYSTGTWSWTSAMSKAWWTEYGESTCFGAAVSLLILCTTGPKMYVPLYDLPYFYSTHATPSWCSCRPSWQYVFQSVICHVLTGNHSRFFPAVPCSCLSFALSLQFVVVLTQHRFYVRRCYYGKFFVFFFQLHFEATFWYSISQPKYFLPDHDGKLS